MMWTSRVFGLVLMLAGFGLLILLSYAVATRGSYWPNVLIGLGMPVVLLSALAGAIAAGLGVWLTGYGRQIPRGTPSRR